MECGADRFNCSRQWVATRAVRAASVNSVRHAFERAAVTYDAAAVPQREVGARMAERLGIIRLAPGAILDAGCGTGDALGELRARYPAASLVGLDLSFDMALRARMRSTPATSSDGPSLLARLLGPRAAPALAAPHIVCGDIDRLPLPAACFDLVWSNLTLQWVEAPLQAFEEFHRVLAVGGLLSFTTLGPDTLRELRSAFAAADAATHVNRFVDMHDLGDMLVECGFADPVMDMEVLTLTYADADGMLRELKAMGTSNMTATRPRGLMGRTRWHRMQEALEAFRREGRLPASFEVIYGHAWKPSPRIAPDGRAIVRFEPRRRS
jgi:malonyl-CoA O-methyltransferase